MLVENNVGCFYRYHHKDIGLSDELLGIFRITFDQYYLNDAFCVFQLYQFNYETKQFELWNKSWNIDEAYSYSGGYYDPYYKKLINKYDTTICVNGENEYTKITPLDVYNKNGINKYINDKY